VNGIAVTGAGGYVGSRLVAALGERATPFVNTVVPWLPGNQIPVDLAGAGGSSIDLTGVDAVVHLAGHNELVAASDPDRALAETVVAARRVADAAQRAGVGRLVYVSTVHVYGGAMVPGARLDEAVLAQPRSVYAVTRLACEHLLAAQATAGGPQPVIFRLTNAVGAPADPGVDRWSLVALDLCRQAVTTGKMTLKSSGTQWRDFVPMADVVDALVLAADGGVAPGTYNLASGRSRTVRQLAELVQERVEAATGEQPRLVAPEAEPDPPGPYSVAADRLAAAGFRSNRTLGDAVDEVVAFCLERRAALTEVVPT